VTFAFDVVIFLREEATRQHATHPNVKRTIHKSF
jgi:hypothetical protein